MKKLLLLGLLIIVSASLFAAGGQQGASSTGSAPASATSTPVGSYPVQTDVTLSYWFQLSQHVAARFSNMKDTHLGKALTDQTGINVDWLHPAQTGVAEAFNLMVADGTNLPDILEYGWIASYPGGPEKAIADGVIIRLNEIIDQYCPNLKAWLRVHPEDDKAVKTDKGDYYCFPAIRDGDAYAFFAGLWLRQDWLNELGLALPASLEELRDVLRAFKERKGAATPLTFPLSTTVQFLFWNAFDIQRGFYVGANDGKVHYGQYESGYRDWLDYMSGLFREGLIDPDFVTNQMSQQVAQRIIGGQAGGAVGAIGGDAGTWMVTGKQNNPNYKLVAVSGALPRTRGGKVTYAPASKRFSGGGPAITTACKNVEIAARFLDYGYSDAGRRLFTFGVEGESYTMQNGNPMFTKAVTEPANGWTVAQVLGDYSRGGNTSGAAIFDAFFQVQYSPMPEQQDGMEKFIVPGAANYVIPTIIPTQEESREMATIMGEVNMHVEEFMTKVIIGTQPLNDATWMTYISTLKQFGIERALEIQNAALTRYTRR